MAVQGGGSVVEIVDVLVLFLTLMIIASALVCALPNV
jgi:hypothetical protein